MLRANLQKVLLKNSLNVCKFKILYKVDIPNDNAKCQTLWQVQEILQGSLMLPSWESNKNLVKTSLKFLKYCM